MLWKRKGSLTLRNILALVLALTMAVLMLPGPALAGKQEESTAGAEQRSESVSARRPEYEESDAAEMQGDPEQAQSTSGEGAVSGTVTGFAQEGPLLRLTVQDEKRPSLTALVREMPSELGVILEEEERTIPVTWFCVGTDYEDGQSYYYQFSPLWDQKRWPLAEELSVVADAPYVAVFVSSEELGTEDAASVELECYNFFVNEMGLNSAGACGILANIYNECAFKSNNLQQYYEKKLGFTDESYTEAVDNGTYTNFVKDSAGYGLVQFTWWTLKRDLLAYAKQKGTSIGDTRTQLEYLQISLGDKRTKDMQAFPNTAKGAYKAGKYFCDEYEKPGLKDQPVARARLARDTFWPKYKDAYARAETGVGNALAAPVLVSLTRTARGTLLAWEGVPGASQYRVSRSDGGDWVTVADTKELSWKDESVVSGKTWTYVVQCLNAQGAVVSPGQEPGLSIAFWAAPVLKQAANVEGGIGLSWSDEGSPRYLVLRSVPGGDWENRALVSGTAWTDSEAVPGQWYLYAVVCANENGEELGERSVTDKLLCMSTPVLRSAVNKGKGIRVRWDAVNGAEGYRVYRKSVGGKWKCIAVVSGGGKTSYLDKTVKKKYGQSYYYTVRALRGSLLSGYQRPGLPACRLAAPKLSAAKGKKKQLKVKWKKVSGAQGYEVTVKQGANTQSVVVKGRKKLSCTVKGLSKGNYQVWVRAWRKVEDASCCSAWSAPRKGKLK